MADYDCNACSIDCHCSPTIFVYLLDDIQPALFLLDGQLANIDMYQPTVQYFIQRSIQCSISY